MGNSFGKLFKITTYGESHGLALGVIIEGCPAGLKIDEAKLIAEMQRRKPGQSKITTQRKEEDEFEIKSGVFEGVTTGTPIGIVINNSDQKSKDYSHISDKFRPSHADFTYFEKYGLRDYRGGGRSSARETAARVVAGAIAKQLLETKGISVQAYVSQVGELKLDKSYTELDLSKAEENILRCPDPVMAEEMIALIDSVRKDRDTIGGVVTCVIKNAPAGIGEPVFDRLHAELGKAMLSINAVKGFEYGSGFEGVKMRGSKHNDTFVQEGNKVHTLTNYSGGIQGGISNGEDIYFNVAFKPVATIMMDQDSVNEAGENVVVSERTPRPMCGT
jgi:chorismate synthase